jgi:hypothetical protein
MASQMNRREFIRHRKESSVRYSMLGSEEYQNGRLIDEGEGGLCMETSAPLKTGSVIYVQLVNLIPDVDGLGADRSFHGRVRWTRDLGDMEQTRFGIGVQFTRPVSLT